MLLKPFKMLAGRRLLAKQSIEKIPLAFGKYKESHKREEDSIVGPCVFATLILTACILCLGIVGDQRMHSKRSIEKS